ncbi:MAG: NAD(P)/FAD-dependent oxidoreductase [Dehalococcoidia bacterium]
MYDAIVVGARCAGSPTAMLLARKGYNVLLVDKSTFPSDIMSTHYIHPPGVEFMRSWGVLDALKATGLPRIKEITMTLGDTTFSPPRPPGADGEMEAYCPRRIILDKLLVDFASEAGAEVREGFSVQELTFDGDRVTGLRGKAKGGAEVTEEARIVIGADGMHSTVAKALKPREYDTQPSLSFGYYAYWSGVPLNGAELYMMEDGGVLAFPTHHDQACIAVGGPIENFQEFRKDIEAGYFKVLDTTPTLAQRVRGGKQEERFIGTADQPNFFRAPFGEGWALVGDAGYHRDFVTGLGITDAFRDAGLLSEAIDEGFSGQRPLGEAMAAYEAKRNEIAKPLYDLTLQLVSGDPPTPEQFMAFGAAMASMMPEAQQVAGA